jgi:hypothetical protein
MNMTSRRRQNGSHQRLKYVFVEPGPSRGVDWLVRSCFPARIVGEADTKAALSASRFFSGSRQTPDERQIFGAKQLMRASADPDTGFLLVLGILQGRAEPLGIGIGRWGAAGIRE